MKAISIISIVTNLLLCVACTGEKTGKEKDLAIGDRIFDKANLLTPPQEDSIFTLIKNLESEIGSQIGVMTLDTLAGQKIEDVSFKLADSLRLGRSTYNDGVLMTIAFRDHSVRIEVGIGLENIIKDEIAAKIIRDAMAPEFRELKFGKGVYNGVDRICKLIRDNKDLIGQETK